jgi:Ca-activated chloride channel homolog
MRASHVLALLLIPAVATAQGRLIPVCPAPRMDGPEIMIACRPSDVVRTASDVRARLNGRVIRYEITERFVNLGGRLGEADYVFPLPAGAAFRDLRLSINGQMVAGETMDAAQARGVYEEIVRRMRDPALVEWMGSGLLRARIFPIQPGETKQVVVSYETVVPREGDALRLDYARRGSVSRYVGESVSRGSGARTTFELRYSDDEPLGVPYSPTNALDTRDSSGTRIVRALGGTNDVTLLLPLRRTDHAAISVLTNASRDSAGFAMITISPPVNHAAPSPRDLTFVLDVSGSMSGRKIEQARAAGRALLATLRPQDRFRMIDFSSDVRDFRDDFVFATRENVRAATAYLNGLQAGGGTNIAGALDEALRDRPHDGGRLPLVLFITDGMPTIGQQNPDSIAAQAAHERGRARVFTFGLGADVNVSLLEQLALEGRGTAQFVRPNEDIERAVGIVAERLVDPVATDLRVRVDGSDVQLRDMVPALPVDLFAGQDLVVMARYMGSGSGRVVVEGRSRGRAVRWTADATFARNSRDNGFIPRLWAAQRIGYLSAERRKVGGSPELDDEIRRLGEHYGIPTEFTSYLVQEPRYAADVVGGVRRPMAQVQPAGVIGAAAVANGPVARFEAAKLAASQRAATSVATLDSLASATRAADGGPAVRAVNGHTLTWRDGRGGTVGSRNPRGWSGCSYTRNHISFCWTGFRPCAQWPHWAIGW